MADDSAVKVNETYKEFESISAKVNGSYREGDTVYVKVNGVWHEAWKNNFPAPSYVTIPSNVTRGETITWSCENIPGAAYEYERRYDDGNWHGLFFTSNSNDVTVSDSIKHNSLQIRVRAVDPVSHDKASAWVYSTKRSLTPQKLSKPSGFSYPNNITRGDKAKISWNNASSAISYQVQTIYTRKDNTKRYYTIFSRNGKYVWDDLSTWTSNTHVQFRIKASRTGHYDSDWETGTNVSLNEERLGRPGYLKAEDGYSGQTITISWGSVSHAESYQLEVQLNNGAFKRVYWGKSRSHRYKITASPGTPIDYRVRATAPDYRSGPYEGFPQVHVNKPPLKKTTWSAHTLRSWRTDFGWSTSSSYSTTVMTQGHWGQWGNHRGLAFFNYGSIKNTLQGKDIEKVRVYFYRTSSHTHGYWAGQSVNLYTHDYAGVPSNRPNLRHLQGPIGSYKLGAGGWLTVSKSLISRMLSNDARGIAIYRSDGTQYVHMTSCKIQVYYR